MPDIVTVGVDSGSISVGYVVPGITQLTNNSTVSIGTVDLGITLANLIFITNAGSIGDDLSLYSIQASQHIQEIYQIPAGLTNGTSVLGSLEGSSYGWYSDVSQRGSHNHRIRITSSDASNNVFSFTSSYYVRGPDFSISTAFRGITKSDLNSIDLNPDDEGVVNTYTFDPVTVGNTSGIVSFLFHNNGELGYTLGFITIAGITTENVFPTFTLLEDASNKYITSGEFATHSIAIGHTTSVNKRFSFLTYTTDPSQERVVFRFQQNFTKYGELGITVSDFSSPLDFSTTAINGGTVSWYENIECGVSNSARLRITNIGTTTLFLESAVITGDFSGNSNRNYQVNLTPGESLTDRVYFDTDTKGNFSFKAIVTSSEFFSGQDIVNESFELNVSYTITAGDLSIAHVSTGTMIAYGSTNSFYGTAGQDHLLRFSITNNGTVPLGITGLEVTGDVIDITEYPNSSVTVGATTFLGYYVGNKTTGYATTGVRIYSTDSMHPLFTFTNVVDFNTGEPILLVYRNNNTTSIPSGTTIAFGNVFTDDELVTRFIVKNMGYSDLTFTGISITGDSVQSIGATPAGLSSGVTAGITFSTNHATVGVDIVSVSITSDDENSPYVFDYRFTVNQQPIPDLDIEFNGVSISNNGLITFGEFTIGSTISVILDLVNTKSDIGLSVGSITFGGSYAEILVNPENTFILPSQSTQAKLSFYGDTLGYKTGFMIVYSNDPDESPYGITLGLTFGEFITPGVLVPQISIIQSGETLISNKLAPGIYFGEYEIHNQDEA